MNFRDLKSGAAGMAVGTLGGLIGLGGAEFRLPLLIGIFGFQPLSAVILNKAMSLLVVAAALPLRLQAVPLAGVGAQWPVILNLLAGSLAGAWLGASWAIRLRSSAFYRVIALLLLAMAIVLLFGHGMSASGQPAFRGWVLVGAGLLAGFGIGVVASLLGVAGGELLIPALILLYGIDIKLAGSLSLAISLPTMIAGFARYSRDNSFAVLRHERRFLLFMAAGSVAGAFVGGQLLRFIDAQILLPVLAAILILSAYKMIRHSAKTG